MPGCGCVCCVYYILENLFPFYSFLLSTDQVSTKKKMFTKVQQRASKMFLSKPEKSFLVALSFSVHASDINVSKFNLVHFGCFFFVFLLIQFGQKKANQQKREWPINSISNPSIILVLESRGAFIIATRCFIRLAAAIIIATRSMSINILDCFFLVFCSLFYFQCF